MARKVPKYVVEYGFPQRREEFSHEYLAFLQRMDNIKITIVPTLH